jgi:hypothetical protein
MQIYLTCECQAYLFVSSAATQSQKRQTLCQKSDQEKEASLGTKYGEMKIKSLIIAKQK